MGGQRGDRRLGDDRPFFTGKHQPESGVGAGPGNGLAAARPVAEAAVGELHREQAVDAFLQRGLHLGFRVFREGRHHVAELVDREPGHHRRGRLFDAAVGVGQQVVDRAGGFGEQ